MWSNRRACATGRACFRTWGEFVECERGAGDLPTRVNARWTQRLVGAGEVDEVDRSYIAWVRHFWSDTSTVLGTADEEHVLASAIDEWDNLVAAAGLAHRTADPHSACALIVATRTFAQYRGRFDVTSWALPILGNAGVEQAEDFAEASAVVAILQCVRDE